MRCGYPWALVVPALQSLWDLISSAPYIKGAAAHDRKPLWCHRRHQTPVPNPKGVTVLPAAAEVQPPPLPVSRAEL